MDFQTVQYHTRRLVWLVAVAAWLILIDPATAQGPIGASSATGGTGTSLYDDVVAALAPVTDVLNDYAALAAEPTTAPEDIWGAQILSLEATGQGPITGSPPAEYYPDAPDQIREAGYTLEGLTTADISAMSALDFAHWLGVTVALPFEIVRGLQSIVSIIGPFGFFFGWLWLAALWVGFVYFLSFLVPFIKSVIAIIAKIVEFIALFM